MNKVFIIVMGALNVMKFYDIFTVGLEEHLVDFFLSLSNLAFVRPGGSLLEKSALGRISEMYTRRTPTSSNSLTRLQMFS